ncbi:MAG: DNA polymerase III subunit beta [Clostridia bacterium]|nr:DNA polymerase III subunit beta [Candidatus Pelethousia sp.]NCB30422.1 DNA polymerase III subunit beta [Clostridia bacterium]
MKFTIQTQELNAGISTVVKAMGTRTTISILEGIYIEASGDAVLLRCTDLSLQIETIVPANIEEEGACVMPGRLFSELVRRLPAEETQIYNEKETIYINSGRARTYVQSESASDFHSMPPVREEYSVTLAQGTLKSMIRQCIFASAQDESKPILTGVLLEMRPEELCMVALDGYRLALRRETLLSGAAEKNAVIPARSLLEISRMLEDRDDTVKVIFSGTHVMMDMGHTKVTTRLLDGEFIRYKQILPDSHTTRVQVNRQELLDSIDRVSLMAREGKKNHIKFSFSTDTLSLSANSEIGSSQEEINVNIVGSDLDIAFNAKYFSDVLKVLEDDELYLDMNNNISPCVVRPIQGERFYYLVLPVRLFTGA